MEKTHRTNVMEKTWQDKPRNTQGQRNSVGRSDWVHVVGQIPKGAVGSMVALPLMPPVPSCMFMSKCRGYSPLSLSSGIRCLVATYLAFPSSHRSSHRNHVPFLGPSPVV